MHDTEPSTSRSLLERIAAILDVHPSAFLGPGRPAFPATGPTPGECDEAAMLYRRIADPRRRAAVMRLLRELASKS